MILSHTHLPDYPFCVVQAIFGTGFIVLSIYMYKQMSKNYSIELFLLTNESNLAASKVYANSMQHTETT